MMDAVNVMYILIMYLNCIFEIYLLYNFLKSMFCTYKDSARIRNLEIIGGGTLIYVVNCFKQPQLNLICVPLIFILFVWLVFRLELKYGFLYVIVYYAIVAVSEFIFLYVYSLFGIDITAAALSRVLLLIIRDVFVFMIIQIIKKQHQSSYSSDSYHYLKNLFILPIGTIILLNGFFTRTKYPINYIFIFLGGILLIISNVVEFSNMEKLVEAVDTAKDSEMIKLKAELEQNHYQRLEEVNQEHADYIHELKRMVRTMEQLASTNDYDAIKTLAFEISEIGVPSKVKTYIGDKILNAIFIEREKVALKKSIKYQIDVQPGIDLEFVSNMDKISMFGNLLDNALEAAETSEEGYVFSSLFIGNNAFTIFRVENNFKIKPQKKGKKYLTIKRDKIKHGFGIKKVEELAQKYGGILNIKDDNNTFIAILLLSNMQKMES